MVAQLRDKHLRGNGSLHQGLWVPPYLTLVPGFIASDRVLPWPKVVLITAFYLWVCLIAPSP
jgi:hypothetical protein